MKFLLLTVLLLPLSLFAQFQENDPVIYSKFFTMMTGIEEIELFRVIQVKENSSVRLRNPKGQILTTHISSIQPIFDTSRIFVDRTIQQLQKQFVLENLKKITLQSVDLAGRFNDSLLFTGEKYLFALEDFKNKRVQIELVDTFHYDDVGLSLLGINEGNPDYFKYIISDDTTEFQSFKEQPIYFELFLKLDGLKLYLDETLKFEFNQSE